MGRDSIWFSNVIGSESEDCFPKLIKFIVFVIAHHCADVRDRCIALFLPCQYYSVILLMRRLVCGNVIVAVGPSPSDDVWIRSAASSEGLATLYYICSVPSWDTLGIGAQPTFQNVTSSTDVIARCYGCHS